MLKLEKGLNLGGWISQCRYEEQHYASFIHEDDFQKIAAMGFDHVRVPLDYKVLETDEGEPLPSGWVHVDHAVAWSKAAGLDIIIDLHRACGYSFNNAYREDGEQNSLFNSPELQQRFLNLWQKIAERYAGERHVAFELLNEVVEDKAAEPWNDLIRRAVAVIRACAKETPIIYGGICWNSTDTLRLLEKPTDPNIIFTFHFYEPLVFTHQRARWVPQIDQQLVLHYPDTRETYVKACSGYPNGCALTASSAKTVEDDFFEDRIAEAVRAASEAGVRLYCGEFGVIDNAPAEDTLRWFRVADRVFRRHRIGWSLWTYKRMNFGLMDEHYDSIRDELLDMWNA